MIRSLSWGDGSRGCDGEASRDVRGVEGGVKTGSLRDGCIWREVGLIRWSNYGSLRDGCIWRGVGLIRWLDCGSLRDGCIWREVGLIRWSNYGSLRDGCIWRGDRFSCLNLISYSSCATFSFRDRG